MASGGLAMHQLFPCAGLTSLYLGAYLERPCQDQESGPNMNCGGFRDLREVHFQIFLEGGDQVAGIRPTKHPPA